MRKFKYHTTNLKCLIIVLMLATSSFFGLAQSRQEKTNTIIDKFKLIEDLKMSYGFQLETLNYLLSERDSVEFIELEKKVTDDEIARRINLAFSEAFSDEEVNAVYEFTQSSAFEKFFSSGKFYQIITSKFNDIEQEIKKLSTQINESGNKPIKVFEPIPVDRKNGFYATVDYNANEEDKNIKLDDKPSLTSNDILEVKKEFNSYTNQFEINVVFTKEGAKKFYLLTLDNIGKPIAVVIDKQIVSIPMVHSEIIGGKMSIVGDFSDDEMDTMIKKLKVKN